MTKTILPTSVVILAVGFAPLARCASHASTGMQKIQALAGNWEGKDGDGNPVKTSFRLIAGETAVMETLRMSGMEEMVTLYSDDGDGIALLHYCPTNNQPRMRAVPAAGGIEELDLPFKKPEICSISPSATSTGCAPKLCKRCSPVPGPRPGPAQVRSRSRRSPAESQYGADLL